MSVEARNSEQTREAIRAAFIIVNAEAADIKLSLRDGELWADYPSTLPPESWRSFKSALRANAYAITALIVERESAS
jgi:hypothetical protein